MRFAGEHHLPVDYLVLSSGAAVMECCTGEYLRSVSMSADQTSAAVGVLTGMELDFTIHRQIPDNHRFLYSMPSGDNPDMDRRIDLYRSHCSPLGMEGHASPSTQLVVISPPERSEGLLPLVSEALGEEYSVLRPPPPLAGKSPGLRCSPLPSARALEWAGWLRNWDMRTAAVLLSATTTTTLIFSNGPPGHSSSRDLRRISCLASDVSDRSPRL